jgi:ABC-type sugar transport system permease subunit
MEILNKKERYSAFLMFFLMFTITTGVLIFALFFNYRLPVKENEVLKAENEKIVKEANFNRVFSDKLQYIGKLIDSLDKEPEKFPFIEQTINVELVDLKRKSDSLEGSKLYENVILNVTKLVSTKKSLSQLTDSKGAIDQLTNENKNLEKINQQLGFDLQLCKAQNKN